MRSFSVTPIFSLYYNSCVYETEMLFLLWAVCLLLKSFEKHNPAVASWKPIVL